MKNYFILCFALAVLWIVPADAGERTDLLFTNSLEEEIVSIRVRYATPYDEPRYNSSRVTLPPGAENWRTGVQGTTLPEQIIFDLATKSYVFDDLSALKPDGEMFLEVLDDGTTPFLRRLNGSDDSVLAITAGMEREYLTGRNRENAVDRDFLTDVATWGEMGELVAKTIVNAGEGAAGVEETVFTEDDGWGETAYFPVRWMDWTGAAKIRALDEDDEAKGIVTNLSFRIPESADEKTEMLDSLLGDLRVDGFRPWRFAMETWDEEEGEGDESELAFHEGDGDKYDDQDAMQERLFAAYAGGTLTRAFALWVKEEAFDAAKAGEEPEPSQGVIALFSRGTFETQFLPDGRMLMEAGVTAF